MKLSRFLLVFLLVAGVAFLFSSRKHKDEKHHKITIHIDGDGIHEEVEANMEEFEAEMENFEEEMEAFEEDLEESMEDMEEGLEEGLEEMTAGIAEMVENLTIETDGEQIKTADFRDLKAILPERLLRMDRESFSGERSGVKGLKVAVAKAKYEDDDRYLEVKIVDGGGLSLAKIINAGWSMVDIDKEDRYGYERTTTIDGHKAIEKYNNRRGKGELALLYNDRFIVALEGKGLAEGDLRKVLNKLDLDELDDL